MKLCSADNCGREAKNKGYCQMHYARVRRTGTTELKSKGKAIEERFHEKYTAASKSGCWLWTGTINRGGYGRIKVKGKAFSAHRISWELHNGPIPRGMCVLHKCDVPACVNPGHLWLGTNKDNSQDALKKGRLKTKEGEDNGQSKLTWLKVKKIRILRKSGQSHEGLAQRFGVSKSAVHRACNYLTWK